MKQGLITATTTETCPLPNNGQTKLVIYLANIDWDFAEYKQTCYLAHVKTFHMKSFPES